MRIWSSIHRNIQMFSCKILPIRFQFLFISPNPQKTVDKSFFRWYYRQAVAWDTGSNLRSNGDREAWKLYRCTILMERVCEVRWKVCWEAESFLKKLFQKNFKKPLDKKETAWYNNKAVVRQRLSTKETAFHEREIFPIEESELIRQ